MSLIKLNKSIDCLIAGLFNLWNKRNNAMLTSVKILKKLYHKTFFSLLYQILCKKWSLLSLFQYLELKFMNPTHYWMGAAFSHLQYLLNGIGNCHVCRSSERFLLVWGRGRKYFDRLPKQFTQELQYWAKIEIVPSKLCAQLLENNTYCLKRFQKIYIFLTLCSMKKKSMYNWNIFSTEIDRLWGMLIEIWIKAQWSTFHKSFVFSLLSSVCFLTLEVLDTYMKWLTCSHY